MKAELSQTFSQIALVIVVFKLLLVSALKEETTDTLTSAGHVDRGRCISSPPILISFLAGLIGRKHAAPARTNLVTEQLAVDLRLQTLRKVIVPFEFFFLLRFVNRKIVLAHIILRPPRLLPLIWRLLLLTNHL